MKMPKLFIFDMDGLIFDSERLFMRELGKIMNEYGYKLTEEIYVRMLGLNGTTLKNLMLDTYGKAYPFEEISQKARACVTECAENGELEIKDGILPLLEFIYANGIPCTVASATHTEYVKNYLRIAGIDKYFSDITGGECVQRSKPNPDIFEKACEKFGVEPSEALVLEDSENGITAAYRAGIRVVCIPDMKYPSKEHVLKTDIILERADMLIEILKN